MLFNSLYNFLKFQVYTPSLNHNCSVWISNDQRYYNNEYWNLMQALNGSRWPSILQNLDTDGFLYKRYLSILGIIFGSLFLIYCFIL